MQNRRRTDQRQRCAAITLGMVDGAGRHGDTDEPALARRVTRAVSAYLDAVLREKRVSKHEGQVRQTSITELFQKIIVARRI